MPDSTEEIQQLLNVLLPHAEQMLNDHGEFYPYAAALDADGDVTAVASPLDDDRADVSDLLLALHEGLRAQAADGSIRASGIAADVTLTDPDSGETTDAVQVELDHAHGEAVDVFVPYESAGDGIKFGDPVAAQGREPVFSAS